MKSWRFFLLGFTLLMVCDTLVQLGFKLTGMHAFPPEANLAWLLRVLGHPWIYLTLAAYLGNFFIWMSLLRHAPVGPAFAASHLDVISVMFASAWLFHEPLTPLRLGGAALIVIGIACLARAQPKPKAALPTLDESASPSDTAASLRRD